MKKTAPKKIALTRETITILSDSHTLNVLGGETQGPCTGTVKVCCPDI